MYHPEYRRLLEKYFVPMNEKLKEWQNTPYERCNKHEEALNIKETQGKMLRSKSEAIIDMLLYKNGIPFRYEEIMHVIRYGFIVRMVLYHQFNCSKGSFAPWE